MDEARDAAEAWFPGAPLCQDAKAGYVEGYVAGVRRARAAVVSVMDDDEDPGMLDTTSRNDNLIDALEAIDALGDA